MELGVSSYSFSQLIDKGAMTQMDAIAKAKELGFDSIEFAELSVSEGQTKEEYARAVRRECDRVGIRISGYSIGADFLFGSDGNTEKEIERVKGEVKIAALLGAPGMRHDVTYGIRPGFSGPKGFRDVAPRLAEACRAVTEYAAGFGIRTMMENHGFFCQDSERVELLVNLVNHKNFGVLGDIGNFLCVDEEPEKAIGRLAPYLFHVHVKDFHRKPGTCPNPGKGWFGTRGGNYLRGAIVGHGEVPVTQCLHIIRNAGYDGVFSLEFEGMEDPILGISLGLANLKSYLNA